MYWLFNITFVSCHIKESCITKVSTGTCLQPVEWCKAFEVLGIDVQWVPGGGGCSYAQFRLWGRSHHALHSIQELFISLEIILVRIVFKACVVIKIYKYFSLIFNTEHNTVKELQIVANCRNGR